MSELTKFDPSKDQIDLIRQTVAPGATPLELKYLLEVAKARNLNPLTKQIYFVKLAGKWTFQVSIDGLRTIAQRSGLYAGQDAPVFQYDDKCAIVSCSVAVYRKDWQRPCVGIAFFKEYVGQNLWQTKPHTMISKVAESIALRKAFSEEMSGLYAPEEFDAAREIPQAAATGIVKAETVLSGPASPPADVVTLEPVTGEILDDVDQTPDEVIRVTFGKNAGKAISDLTIKQIEAYVEIAAKTLADPAKERFHAEQEQWIEHLKAELGRRDAA